MTEILFILTTIFVAYVIYSIVNEQKVSFNPVRAEAQAQSVTEQVKPEIVEKKEPPVMADKGEMAEPAVQPVATPKGSVRDPKTGEVAAVSNNYRFTKRWIKEALVAEGLLDKVYKNNELDAAAEGLIKTALMALATMDKYRA